MMMLVKGSLWEDVAGWVPVRLIDVGAGKKFQCKPKRLVAPTLTRTRAAQSGFWLTKLNRALSPTDACSQFIPYQLCFLLTFPVNVFELFF